MKTNTSVLILSIASALGILSSTSLAAQELKLASSQFSEQYASNVPVSGRILVGAVLVGETTNSDFAVRIPSASYNEVCVKVQSRDGSYNAENSYQLDNVGKGGVFSLEYPSKHIDMLKNMKINEIAVISTPGNCAEQKHIDKVYLSYRGEPATTNKLYVLANSGRSDVFMRLQVANAKTNHRCSAIDEGVRTGFDTLCEIEPSALRQGENEITLLRRQSGRMLPPVQFSLIY